MNVRQLKYLLVAWVQFELCRLAPRSLRIPESRHKWIQDKGLKATNPLKSWQATGTGVCSGRSQGRAVWFGGSGLGRDGSEVERIAEFGYAFRALDPLHQALLVAVLFRDTGLLRTLWILRRVEDWRMFSRLLRMPKRRLTDELDAAWTRLDRRWQRRAGELASIRRAEEESEAMD